MKYKITLLHTMDVRVETSYQRIYRRTREMLKPLTMASILIRCKHPNFSFTLLYISLICIFVLATNHLYFVLNYSTHLLDDFDDVFTYLETFKNRDWLDVVSRDIIDKRIKLGLVRTDHQIKNHKTSSNPMWFDVIRREFKVPTINIGLVNTDKIMDEGQTQARLIEVQFDRVGTDIRWSDLAPERMDENSTCPDIPMPRFGDYKDLDVVIARVPRTTSDVFRLQVNLVVANLMVRSGREGSGPLLAVFVGSLDPMWEIFRCDDLLWNEGDTWIYRPELERIMKVVLMPVGACQFVPPLSHFGDDQEPWRSPRDADLSRPREAYELLISPPDDDLPRPWPREAYVTILHTSEDYVCGAIVLAQSLIQSNTTKDLILLADHNISPRSIHALRSAGWKTEPIQRLRSPFSRKDTYNEWNYSKLRIWQLKQYDKIMFVDSDLIVIKNLDGFFAYPQLSAAGNYQKHFFNSGVMLVEPSQCMFDTLIEKMRVVESYNGGDQGFLNEMFPWWHRLPHEVNFMKVFLDKGDEVHLVGDGVFAVHYTGMKPWKCTEDQRDCNWDVPEFHRYASDSAYRMWWRVYAAMPEKLRSHCALNRYKAKNYASPEKAL